MDRWTDLDRSPSLGKETFWLAAQSHREVTRCMLRGLRKTWCQVLALSIAESLVGFSLLSHTMGIMNLPTRARRAA